ncbi:hypothetical protein NM688_g8329 [Phlebia brevispora]|uniref:Uncharacterized protein n=1 Tax=Phlebia brevispora TaxID=194682 RepID=A0ACC1RU37_9APHY|nr:hypothetical protein NM688_g8329 [Phlebia brevispora]
MAWVGLERYGYLEEAQRLAYRFVYMMTTAFVDFNGVVPEKFDAVKLSHLVDAEYGNQGIDFKLVPREGFGWMNAAYQVGISYLSMGMRRAVAACTSPEVFFGSAPLAQPILSNIYPGSTTTDPLNLAMESLNLSEPLLPPSSSFSANYTDLSYYFKDVILDLWLAHSEPLRFIMFMSFASATAVSVEHSEFAFFRPIRLCVEAGGLYLATTASDSSTRLDEDVSATGTPSLHFTLRQLHAVSPSSRVVFKDVAASEASLYAAGENLGPIATRRVKSSKPFSHEAFVDARRRSARFRESVPLDWNDDDVLGPDVTKRETLLLLAKMTSNSYYNTPGAPGWYELGDGWNVSYPFGWDPDDDGFRGHIFATEDNSTVVLSIKGTTVPWIGDGGPTSSKDKFNDNLLFSCCCARVDWSWSTVCDCYRGQSQCDQDCLEKALTEESLFYNIGTNLYFNVTYMYPNSNIWIIGHSLGGSLAALLGATFGTPVVAFEAPAEKLAASRLHLPSPPSVLHITHVYHTADPVPMGTCTGVLSSCALAGYAFETKCHQGVSIIYDTVSNLSWSVNIQNHGIVTVIENILNKTWLPSKELGLEVPEAHPEEDCVVRLALRTVHEDPYLCHPPGMLQLGVWRLPKVSDKM